MVVVEKESASCSRRGKLETGGRASKAAASSEACKLAAGEHVSHLWHNWARRHLKVLVPYNCRQNLLAVGDTTGTAAESS